MMEKFEYDECMLMAMYQKGSRRQTIEEIHNILPFVADDSGILTLAVSTIEKMENITDAEFDSMDLEPYKTGPLEGC